MRPGKQLEEVIANLERVLTAESGAAIESPGYLEDRTTGQRREFDVLVRRSLGHNEMIVAIECRDRSRKIGSPQVEAFLTKCRDAGVHQGVIVSTSGFYKPARDKATAKGIRCLELTEVTRFDWFSAVGMQTRRRKPTAITATLEAVGLDLSDLAAGYALEDASGQAVHMQSLQERVQAAAIDGLRRTPWTCAPGETPQPAEIELQAHGLSIIRESTGERTPVSKITCTIEFEVSNTPLPTKLVRYRDITNNEKAAEGVVTDLEKAGFKGTAILLKDLASGDGPILFLKRREVE